MTGQFQGATVKFTEIGHDPDKDNWQVVCEWSNGLRWLYTFPRDTMEWRAAEYGIDPNDRATLLDIVMAEPWMTEEDWQQGSHMYGTHGVMSMDQEQARNDHIARAARVKLRHRISTRGVDHVLNTIRDNSHMDPKVLAVKAQHVYHNHMQAMHDMTKAQAAQIGHEERADRLRKHLPRVNSKKPVENGE